MDLILDEKDAADWVYRGEGAANIVVAYAGSSPSFVGKVLRIQKVPVNGTHCANGTSVFSTQEKLLWEDFKDLVSSPTKEVAAQLYVEHVMSPLLGSKHVDAGVQILVSEKFMEAVEKNTSSQRPTWRINAAKIDTLGKHALLISDHSCFSHVSGIHNNEPCISVEIKPKCGFLPTSRYIAKQNAIKRTVSRFQMHQVLKLHKQEIPELSDYDPLDLFSGSEERMQKALEALHNTPQNNFRVFLNGSLVLGGLGGVADTTTKAIGETFESMLRGIIQANDGHQTQSFLELIVEALRKSNVLDRLLEVQKLDDHDIEGAIHAYYNLVSQPCVVCRDMEDDDLLGKCDSLHLISLEESLKIVKNFLVAATAKDCSLMLCFGQRTAADVQSSYNKVYLQSTDQVFDYKAFFIDLDMKLLEKMEYYHKLDQKIVSYYNRTAKKENANGLSACTVMYPSTN